MRANRSASSLSLLAAALLLSSSSAWAENLMDAYQQAYHTDPVLAQARAELSAQMQDKPLARSALLPHVGVGASVGFNTADITGFGNIDINRAYLSDSYSVNITQSVFNGQAWTALKQADSRIQASAAGLTYSEQQLALQVAKAYFGVLEAQAQERVAQKQKSLLESIYKQTEATLKIGTGDIIAVREAQARVDAAEADLIKASNGVAIAGKQLQRLTHHPIGVLEPLGHYQALGPQPDDMQSWVHSAVQDQPLMHQAQDQLHTAQQEVQYHQRARWPVVNLQGVAQHALGNPFPGLIMNQAGVSLNLSVPLYEGGNISASVQKAQAQTVASVDHVANVRDEVTLNTQTAFLNLKNSVAQLKAAKETVNSAQLSLEGTRKGYEVGTRSIIDLLHTATDYVRAEQDYNVAFYNQVIARVQLKAASGQINMADLQAINALLKKSA
ncbi:TolC family outer membrane protein [Acidithiobacillus sulfurivorans]|uniref:TolC family outer membrane protein n=2 Tax=Acidithiobacillus TaxID=119977 RepID=A0ABS5ZVP3_9PROT|nr:TolC family outer membrane protein [Acidithiobacillus sulfurivorans]MBU2759125.1 TolC family outer membrane protein [Acidithiobacillus sulfurivorans]